MPEPTARRAARLEPVTLALIVVAAAVYHWLQAQGRVTPWIFPDEMRYAEAARAVAETGSPRVRGELELDGVLGAYLMAPAWLIDETGRAWSAAKGIAAVSFSLTAVPVFLMARRLAGFVPSALAAAAAVLLPAAFYASTTLQEPVAIPLAALAALLTARLVESFSWPLALALGAACAIAALARGQLVVLLGAAAVALLAEWACRADRRDRRPLWTGLAALALAAVALLVRAGALDGLERVVADPLRAGEVIARSAGATAIAVALVPAVAYGVMATRLRDRSRPVAALAATLIGFAVVLLGYVGAKAAVLGFPPISLVEERNLVYLEPLAMVALAALAGPAPRRALIASAAAVAALVVSFPLATTVTSEILSENPGLSWAGRLAADPRRVDPSLVAVLGAVVLLGAVALGRGRLRVPLLAAVAVAVAWGGALAYRGDHDFARYILASSWPVADRSVVDARAAGRPVLVVVGRDADPTTLWTAAFWNRRIGDYADFDRFGPRNVGLAGRRTTVSPEGLIDTGDAGLVLHQGAVAVVGRPVAAALPPAYRLTAPPPPAGRARVAAVLEGRTPDGWAGATLRVVRYLDGPPGRLRVDVSTQNPVIDAPRTVVATVAGVSTGVRVPPATVRRLSVPVPAGPWGTEFVLTPARSPGPGDPRRLSLLVGSVRVPGVPAPLG